MATQPVAYYKRRFIRRAFVEDLPEDLRDTGTLVSQMIMRPGFVERLARDHARHAGKAPFDRPAHLNLPAMPPRSRQISSVGTRTFHMGFGDAKRVASAGASDAYASAKAARASEIDAVEEDRSHDTSPDHESHGPAVADAYAVGHGGEEKDSQLRFTNLHTDLEVRKRQWDQIERVTSVIGLERKSHYERGEDRLNIRVASAPGLVTAIAADPACPEALRSLIGGEQQRLADGRTLNKRREAIGAPLVTEDAAAIHDWVRTTDAWATASDDERKALKFSGGRGRKFYGSFDVEFPAEFDARACGNVMQALVDHIANLPGDPDHAIPGTQVPTLGAVHFPNGLNNLFNRHAHVVHARYKVVIGEDGKLPADDGDLVVEPVMPPALTDLSWKKQLRAKVADLVNIELERLDVSYRLDPRTDREIGNSGTPMKKIYNEATVLARAGVPSPLRLENAAEGWRRHFEAIDRARADDLERAEKRRAARRKRITTETPTEEHDELCALADRILAVDTRAIDARHERQTIEGLIDMARSAPEEVAQYATEYARQAMQGAGSIYVSKGWQQRAEEAVRHLAALDLELAEERQGIAERLQIERDAERNAGRMVSTLILDMARATWDEFAPERNIAQVPTLASIPSIATPTRPSPHRAIGLIDAHAIRISVDGNRLFVDPLDDPDGRVAGVDLAAAALQNRLSGVKAKQDGELKAVGAYIARHGPPSSTEEGPATLTPWLEKAITKWNGSRTFAAMVEDAARARSVPPQAEPRIDERETARPAEVVSPPAITLKQEEVERTLARQIETATQRADAAMAKLLSAKMWQDGKPTPMVRQFLIDVYAAPEHYRLGQDGELTCIRSGGRASAFALMMRDPAVADHARRYHQAGSNREALPLPQWLGVDPRLPIHHYASAAWIGTARRDQHELSKALPALLASRPKLTMGPGNLLGVRDEGLVQTAGNDALGLFDRTIQMRLRAAWLVQREEERDALAMIAAGDVEVALKREKPSGTLKLGSKNPASLLPPLFDPFLGDPAFVGQALAARTSGAPARSTRPALLRAWDAAARELGEVRSAIAEMVLADPEAARQLGPAERSALEQSVGRASTSGRGARRHRSGRGRTGRTR